MIFENKPPAHCNGWFTSVSQIAHAVHLLCGERTQTPGQDFCFRKYQETRTFRLSLLIPWLECNLKATPISLDYGFLRFSEKGIYIASSSGDPISNG
jgi:hypothetical protein